MRPLTLALLLTLGSIAAAAPQAPPETTDRFATILKKLGSDEYADREAASTELAALPVEAFTLVQAELKKAGLDAEVRTRLEASVAAFKSKARRGAATRKK